MVGAAGVRDMIHQLYFSVETSVSKESGGVERRSVVVDVWRMTGMTLDIQRAVLNWE